VASPGVLANAGVAGLFDFHDCVARQSTPVNLVGALGFAEGGGLKGPRGAGKAFIGRKMTEDTYKASRAISLPDYEAPTETAAVPPPSEGEDPDRPALRLA
jgi:hypothetical protein